ncbi:hypothetical protein BDY21DRAFT_367034 [Lineolata rhizophorae]|uniref:Uncharacterized protein n=1 Tax=Lineolata rhizophorae TaxID=578093 RepID=A0A6A6NPS4_9PEZI|nr:hypothetical protein BDY21DRAFT_367034 [Lineolata rhizophorae]
MVLGLMVITAIPTVTGISLGVREQKKQNAEMANESRMVKFNLEVYCEAPEINGTMIVLRNDKVYVHPKNPTTNQPLPSPTTGRAPHPFTGFYIQYPDEERSPTRGLVSTISNDPPMLNWIYCDKDTHELKYGNRTQSREHIIGEWDWTKDEVGLTLEGWEGFVAVEEEPGQWALYYDRNNDNLRGLARPRGKRKLQCSLERKILPEEMQNKDK